MTLYRLGEIAPIIEGTVEKNDKYWLLNLDMVERETGRIIGYNFVSENEIGNSTVPFDTGNVLYSKLRPYLNKVVLPQKAGYATSEMVPLRPDTSIITREYLTYLLRSPMFVSFINSKTSGAKMPRAKLAELKKFEIKCPSIVEQKIITDRFDELLEAIGVCESIIDKLNMLCKSRFVEMFGDINTNSKGWISQPLGELCTIVRGGSPRPIEQYLRGDVPWIKISDATEGDSIYLHSTKEHIIKEGVKRSRLVKSGSLIFANCGVSLGFARIITFDGCIHDGWLAMGDIDSRLDKVFLLQSLNQMTEHFRKIAPAGTQPNLNTAIMKSYMQIIPPMECQNEFVAFSEQVDKSKSAVLDILEKLKTLQKSLMQEYFC